MGANNSTERRLQTGEEDYFQARSQLQPLWKEDFKREFSRLDSKEISLCALGAVGVGMSSCIKRFVHGNFSEADATVSDTYTKQIEINSEQLNLKILDTAGKPLPVMETNPVLLPPRELF